MKKETLQTKITNARNNYGIAQQEFKSAEFKRDHYFSILCHYERVEQALDNIKNKKTTYCPLWFAKEYHKGFSLLLTLIKENQFELNFLETGQVELCIFKTKYGKEHQLTRKNIYENCPTQIMFRDVADFNNRFVTGHIVRVDALEKLTNAAESYAGDKNIFLAICLFFYRQTLGTTGIVTVSYKEIGDAIGASDNTIRKILQELEDLGAIVKLRQGTVFTAASAYKVDFQKLYKN